MSNVDKCLCGSWELFNKNFCLTNNLHFYTRLPTQNEPIWHFRTVLNHFIWDNCGYKLFTEYQATGVEWGFIWDWRHDNEYLGPQSESPPSHQWIIRHLKLYHSHTTQNTRYHSAIKGNKEEYFAQKMRHYLSELVTILLLTTGRYCWITLKV